MTPFEEIKPPAVEDICRNREHNPPSMYHYRPGYTYVWVCPSCGFKTVIRQPEISMKACHDA